MTSDHADTAKLNPPKNKDWTLYFIGGWQLLMLIFFAAFTEYKDFPVADVEHAAMYPYVTACLRMGAIQLDCKVDAMRRMFQDVHIMMLVGFGFLMTVVSRYSWSAIGFNFLLTVLVIQWHTLVSGFWGQVIEGEFHTIEVSINSLLTGDFASACVLIAFGALLGRTTAFQLSVMACLQIVVFSLSEHLVVHYLHVADIGGSMVVHVFGAYFGLAASWALGTNSGKGRATTSKTNSITAMVGTLFLFAFWPSFNGALATGAAQHRVIVNTVVALCGSASAAFVLSAWLRGGKFDMEDIQNATLAGGVAVGTSANFVLQPWAALLIGLIAGVVSVLGYVYLTPLLASKLKIEDTCGVHNLHGMPGVLAGLISTIVAATVSADDYGGQEGLNNVFAGAAEGFSASKLATNQFLTLLIAFGFCVAGGVATGFVMSKLPRPAETFDDSDAWAMHGLDQKPNELTAITDDEQLEEGLLTVAAVRSMIAEALKKQEAQQAVAGATARTASDDDTTLQEGDIEIGMDQSSTQQASENAAVLSAEDAGDA